MLHSADDWPGRRERGLIKSFADKELERCWKYARCAKIKPDLHRRVLMRLDFLDAAKGLEDAANIPGGYLHPLKGERTGEYALSVNGPWRLVFRFEQGGFTRIRLEQYH